MARVVVELKAKELEEELPKVTEDAENRTKTWVNLAQTVALETVRAGEGHVDNTKMCKKDVRSKLTDTDMAKRIKELETEIAKLKSADP